MKKNDKFIDGVRRQGSEIENHIIDEFAAGHIGRRDFLRHGSVIGMSLPLLTGLAGAFGSSLWWRSDRALHLAGLEARRADVEALRGAGDDGTHTLDVRVPAAARPLVRVRDAVPEARALGADVAVGCHGVLLVGDRRGARRPRAPGSARAAAGTTNVRGCRTTGQD